MGAADDAFTVQPDASADHDADIDAPYAWAIMRGSTSTRIAVLDSGIDQNHEDLAAKIVSNHNVSSSKTVDASSARTVGAAAARIPIRALNLTRTMAPAAVAPGCSPSCNTARSAGEAESGAFPPEFGGSRLRLESAMQTQRS